MEQNGYEQSLCKTGCVPGANLYGAGTIALLTHRSPLNNKGGDAADRMIRNLGVGRAVVSINDVDILRGGENPCWWGHPLTKGSQT